MDFLEINTLLNRNSIVKEIEEFLNNFEKNKYNVLIKRGIYIYGPPGSGKTFFIKQILKELNYDIISYDSGEIRNKCIIENITQNNITDTNVLSLLTKNHRKIALLMDEIDGMNSGDKGGINSLIKLIRPKKTKKQKLEEITKIPVICIGNFHIDKKINELIKVCNSIILNSPSDSQICSILKTYIPNIPQCNIYKFVNYIQNDFRKFFNIYNLYIKDNSIFTNSNFLKINLAPKFRTLRSGEIICYNVGRRDAPPPKKEEIIKANNLGYHGGRRPTYFGFRIGAIILLHDAERSLL